MNYIAEIQEFNNLLLSEKLSTGQVALWYALMYINNKCHWVEWFSAPNLTLELHTGLSRQGILKARNVLKQLGLIDFKSNGTKASNYTIIQSSCRRTDIANSVQASSQDEHTIANSVQDSIQSSVQDSIQSSVQDSIQNSSTLNKQNKTKQNKTIKHKYGEYKNVLLSDEELFKLKEKFANDWENRIETLSTGIELKGYKYKNHYLAILKWAKNDFGGKSNNQPQSAKAKTKFNNFDSTDKTDYEALNEKLFDIFLDS